MTFYVAMTAYRTLTATRFKLERLASEIAHDNDRAELDAILTPIAYTLDKLGEAKVTF